MSELDVVLADGRALHVYDDGDPDGFPVVVHHGTPSSGMPYAPHVEDARRRGIRLVGYDRAGYGGSTPRPGRSVADVAADVAAIAGALGFRRFATWGISGGGPHALACAALLPERVTAAAALASPAPWNAPGLDWLAGQGEANVAEWEAALRGRGALEELLAAETAQMLAAGSEGLRDGIATVLSQVDRDALTGAFAEHMFASTVRALSPGVDGWIDDDLAFTRPWGFEPAEIRVPLLLWQGEHDLMVPPDHGRWLARRIPHAEARIRDDDGHLTLIEQRVPEVHAWLLEHA